MYFSVAFGGVRIALLETRYRSACGYKLRRAGRRSVGDYLDPADSIPTYEPLYVHYLSALR